MQISYADSQARPSALQFSHDVISIHSRACLQFIDLTEAVRARVAASGIRYGMVHVQTRHTTAAVMINEHEPLLLEDLRQTLERVAPREARYRHDDFDVRTVNLTPEEKANGHAHCKALFLRSSEVLQIIDGELQLGCWQRIFFIELDCARERTVSVMVIGA